MLCEPFLGYHLIVYSVSIKKVLPTESIRTFCDFPPPPTIIFIFISFLLGFTSVDSNDVSLILNLNSEDDKWVTLGLKENQLTSVGIQTGVVVPL